MDERGKAGKDWAEDYRRTSQDGLRAKTGGGDTVSSWNLQCVEAFARHTSGAAAIDAASLATARITAVSWGQSTMLIGELEILTYLFSYDA